MTAQDRIDAARLRSALLRPAGSYSVLDVVPTTGSTNADLRAAAAQDAPDRAALLAEEQTAGTGRRGRTWNSPSAAGVYCSVLLRPEEVPVPALGTLSLVAGLALVDLANAVGLEAVLKWPNDVLAGPQHAKWAGILAESLSVEEPIVVLGIGVNVAPVPDPVRPGALPATSLREQGSSVTDRTEVAGRLLTFLGERERCWRAGGGDLRHCGLLDDYRANCLTLGRDVTVQRAPGPSRSGRAVDVDGSGALVLETGAGVRDTIHAGEVLHLRPNQA